MKRSLISNNFERLRYPDAVIEEGAQMLIGKFVSPPSANEPPLYQIDPRNVDRLVGRIFELCSRNPVFFIGGMNPFGREAIMHDNPIGEVFKNQLDP